MQDRMRWIILAAMLIHLKPSDPRPISLSSTSQPEETSGEKGPQRSAEPTGAQGWPRGADGMRPLLDCDRESLIVDFSPSQHTDLYLLIDEKLLVSLKDLLQECSHVELQPSPLIRVFFTGCYLQDWVGQNTHFSLKLGFSHKTLKEDNVSSQSCPSATSGPRLQFPQLTCGFRDVTVKLLASEVKTTQIIAPDTSQELGLTQERIQDFLIITVNVRRTEDLAELVLQYTDVRDELYTAKMFCPRYRTKPQFNKETASIFRRFYRNGKVLRKRAISVQTTQISLPRPRPYLCGAAKHTQASDVLNAMPTLAISSSRTSNAASPFVSKGSITAGKSNVDGKTTSAILMATTNARKSIISTTTSYTSYLILEYETTSTVPSVENLTITEISTMKSEPRTTPGSNYTEKTSGPESDTIFNTAEDERSPTVNSTDHCTGNEISTTESETRPASTSSETTSSLERNIIVVSANDETVSTEHTTENCPGHETSSGQREPRTTSASTSPETTSIPESDLILTAPGYETTSTGHSTEHCTGTEIPTIESEPRTTSDETSSLPEENNILNAANDEPKSTVHLTGNCTDTEISTNESEPRSTSSSVPLSDTAVSEVDDETTSAVHSAESCTGHQISSTESELRTTLASTFTETNPLPKPDHIIGAVQYQTTPTGHSSRSSSASAEKASLPEADLGVGTAKYEKTSTVHSAKNCTGTELSTMESKPRTISGSFSDIILNAVNDETTSTGHSTESCTGHEVPLIESEPRTTPASPFAETTSLPETDLLIGAVDDETTSTVHLAESCTGTEISTMESKPKMTSASTSSETTSSLERNIIVVSANDETVSTEHTTENCPGHETSSGQPEPRTTSASTSPETTSLPESDLIGAVRYEMTPTVHSTESCTGIENSTEESETDIRGAANTTTSTVHSAENCSSAEISASEMKTSMTSTVSTPPFTTSSFVMNLKESSTASSTILKKITPTPERAERRTTLLATAAEANSIPATFTIETTTSAKTTTVPTIEPDLLPAAAAPGARTDATASVGPTTFSMSAESPSSGNEPSTISLKTPAVKNSVPASSILFTVSKDESVSTVSTAAISKTAVSLTEKETNTQTTSSKTGEKLFLIPSSNFNRLTSAKTATGQIAGNFMSTAMSTPESVIASTTSLSTTADTIPAITTFEATTDVTTALPSTTSSINTESTTESDTSTVSLETPTEKNSLTLSAASDDSTSREPTTENCSGTEISTPEGETITTTEGTTIEPDLLPATAASGARTDATASVGPTTFSMSAESPSSDSEPSTISLTTPAVIASVPACKISFTVSKDESVSTVSTAAISKTAGFSLTEEETRSTLSRIGNVSSLAAPLINLDGIPNPTTSTEHIVGNFPSTEIPTPESVETSTTSLSTTADPSTIPASSPLEVTTDVSTTLPTTPSCIITESTTESDTSTVSLETPTERNSPPINTLPTTENCSGTEISTPEGQTITTTEGTTIEPDLLPATAAPGARTDATPSVGPTTTFTTLQQPATDFSVSTEHPQHLH